MQRDTSEERPHARGNGIMSLSRAAVRAVRTYVRPPTPETLERQRSNSRRRSDNSATSGEVGSNSRADRTSTDQDARPERRTIIVPGPGGLPPREIEVNSRQIREERLARRPLENPRARHIRSPSPAPRSRPELRREAPQASRPRAMPLSSSTSASQHEPTQPQEVLSSRAASKRIANPSHEEITDGAALDLDQTSLSPVIGEQNLSGRSRAVARTENPQHASEIPGAESSTAAAARGFTPTDSVQTVMGPSAADASQQELLETLRRYRSQPSGSAPALRHAGQSINTRIREEDLMNEHDPWMQYIVENERRRRPQPQARTQSFSGPSRTPPRLLRQPSWPPFQPRRKPEINLARKRNAIFRNLKELRTTESVIAAWNHAVSQVDNMRPIYEVSQES